MNRRKFIALSSVGAIPAISGCSGSEDTTDTDSEESTSTDTPKNNSTDTAEPAEFEVKDLTSDSAELGENVYMRVEIENVGDQRGEFERGYRDAVTYGSEPEEWDDNTISGYVPANDSIVRKINLGLYDQPAVIYYQIEDRPEQEIHVPESKEPIITETNLISEWNSFGDVLDNKITEAEVGDEVDIAFRYWYWLENQSIEAFRQTEIFDESGDRVEIRTNSFEQVSEYSGWREWESYYTFYTDDWDAGTYTAETQIRDEQNQEVSEVGTVEFELV